MVSNGAPITITRAEIFVFRAPVEEPVRTSFGVMRNRPAVLIRLEDKDGAHGWGEAWCNFPACGAEHRARLLETVLAPLILGKTYARPGDAFRELTGQTAILALQADEPGPLAQAIAAVDIAMWDLAARKAGQPLYRFLGGQEDVRAVPAYASGINPTGVAQSIERSRAAGYVCFKIKIGFGQERDEDNIKTAFGMLRPGEGFGVDANQAWTLSEALNMAGRIADFPLMWLEEPLRCDAGLSQWDLLRQHCPIALAAGENMRSAQTFERAIASRAFGVIQPDMCKWGGFTLCLPTAKSIMRAGVRYCPHYLGGGIGLVASAHLLAAAGGDGLLEVDSNPNPLRELLAGPYPAMRGGMFVMPQKPGLGVEPALRDVADMRTLYAEVG